VTTTGNIMRVSNTTPPQAIASAIKKAITEDPDVSIIIRAIGAGAVAQACKGIAIARGLVAVSGRDLFCAIGFDTIRGNSGDEISAQTFHLIVEG
jgi:stage V sporulation protein S